MASRPLSIPLENFGDAVWRANALGGSAEATVVTGHPVLDAQLPGGGWPVGAISEILQLQSGQHEWRLLLPALTRADLGPVVVLVGAPHVPFGPGLAMQGFDARRLLWVNVAALAERLWAAEQALRCTEVAAVLAWLPQARGQQLRRLQIAASVHHKLLFVMRPAQAQSESSPAVLRLLVAGSAPGVDAPTDALRLQILKRRGPPLAQALLLSERNAHLGVLRAVSGRADAGALNRERDDALDRLAAAA